MDFRNRAQWMLSSGGSAKADSNYLDAVPNSIAVWYRSGTRDKYPAGFVSAIDLEILPSLMYGQIVCALTTTKPRNENNTTDRAAGITVEGFRTGFAGGLLDRI